MNQSIAVSFVHGYENLNYCVDNELLPALWVNTGETGKVYNYPFPRNVSDFQEYKSLISGAMPLPNSPDFKKLPRFGLTGLAEFGEFLYAGSWNAIYEIRKSDFELARIISNPLMNDMHGILADEKYLITLLTGKDTVVINDYNGDVIDHFTIANDLSVYKDESIEKIDWRFLSKQYRGATGIWHFNYVQRFGDEIWLTSRNLNAFIVVNMKTRKSWIRCMNQKTPVLLHDGLRHGDEYFFTSIDGKIIIASDADKSLVNVREKVAEIGKFSRDMVCELIRLDETEFGREPNWCRGIACAKDVMYVTVDGRYDSDLSFGLLGLKRDGSVVLERRLQWSSVGSVKDLRYVTGFDIAVF
jgi:hypothetical protein